MAFMRTIAEKVSRELEDLGSVNPLIDREISNKFLGTHYDLKENAKDSTAKSDEAINRTLAGSVELNRQLTGLASEYDSSKAQMHLTAQSERRVVDTALELTNQPKLIPVNDDPENLTFRLPELNPGWRSIADGLRTRLNPNVVQSVTFDEKNAQENRGVVYMHLGSELMSKASRTLRGNLYGQETKLHRVTAVVVPDLDYTCAAAVSRLVLVGRGGLRVHEEVFVTGLRFRAQNLAEEKVQNLLSDTLDASRQLKLADRSILEKLEREWSANNGRLRDRLEDAVGRRARSRQEQVTSSLKDREEVDLARAHGIFEQFRLNLNDSLESLRRQDENDLQLTLWEDDERRQRQRDIRKMEQRLDDLGAEEQRELETIRNRYRDVKPYVSIAALVFAVSPQDAAQWKVER
ncbi:hypothetical protein [Bifidobacterium pseudocatenulatum]|nr:hypothetical protein [Bifidobacterium pseudocatenulatum]